MEVRLMACESSSRSPRSARYCDSGTLPRVQRASFGEGLEIQAHVDHGSGKIAGRRAGRRKSFQLTAASNATGVIENHFAYGRAHGNFENAGARNLSADADKFQAA